jgi:hypothetical protein
MHMEHLRQVIFMVEIIDLLITAPTATASAFIMRASWRPESPFKLYRDSTYKIQFLAVFFDSWASGRRFLSQTLHHGEPKLRIPFWIIICGIVVIWLSVICDAIIRLSL